MNNFEKLIKDIMKEAEKDGEPITREEAEEMAKMEMGAKQIKRYEQAEKPRKKPIKPKTVKISDEKKILFHTIFSSVLEYGNSNVEVLKENKLIQVIINGKTFKIDIIQQRNK